MKKIWILLVSFWVIYHASEAQKTKKKDKENPKQTEVVLDLSSKNSVVLENSVFWEISGNELPAPSYLFGTHHLYPADSIKKNDFIKEKIKECKVVVGELVMDNLMAHTMATMKYSIMQDTTLQDLLGEKDYQRVDEYMKKNMGMGVAMFNRMRPMVLVQTITSQKAMQALGKENKISSMDVISNNIDYHFQQYGKSIGKEIAGLETVEFQSKVLLHSIPLRRQAEMLLEAIEDKGSQSFETYKKLNQFYQQQNLNELAKLSFSEMKKDEYDNLLKKRNDAWMPQIEKIIREKSAFFAVGALHLVGTDGIIYQLRQKGYSVKPLKIRL
ncbi:MAG: TraB/GumN family protein [Raineya sp.]|nr:TraB/GumN family protein [Raineya sp.]